MIPLEQSKKIAENDPAWQEPASPTSGSDEPSVEDGWPATLPSLPEDLLEEAHSLGFSLERLIEIAEDASASFEYLSRVG